MYCTYSFFQVNFTFNTLRDFFFFWTNTSSTTSSMLCRGFCLIANSGVARKSGSHFFSSLSLTYFCASRIIGLGGLSSRSLPQPPPASATYSYNGKLARLKWFHILWKTLGPYIQHWAFLANVGHKLWQMTMSVTIKKSDKPMNMNTTVQISLPVKKQPRWLNNLDFTDKIF